MTSAQTGGEILPADSSHELQGLVSVVIIFFNEERFLAEAVASVYAQTYHAWELLLVDDGSSDRSTEMARGFVERDPGRVRYLQHPGHVNRGEGATRNLGVRAAQGEWVAFLDADDVWLPARLERSMALTLEHADADMIYGRAEDRRSWDARGSTSSDRIQPHYFRADRLLPPPDLLIRHLSLRAAYPCPSSLSVRRRAFLAVGGFEESFGGVAPTTPSCWAWARQDLVFLAKFCLQHPVYVSEECWDRYRQHSDSVTAHAEAQGGTRDAQRAYLAWLADYCENQGVRDARVHRALRAAMRRSAGSADRWRARLERIWRRVVRWRVEG